MKPIDVYAIGNALVDYDFEVSEESLERLGIEKGVMTLIDAGREQQLLEDLDGIKHVKACGGSAANTAITVQQLGGKSFYSCRVAKGVTGDFFLESLTEAGVASNLQASDRESGTTGKCIAMITPDAERTMNTYLGVSKNLCEEDLVIEELQAAKYFYIEGYLVTTPGARQAVLKGRDIARASGAKVALTLSDCNMVRYHKEDLLNLMSDDLDLLFCNENEALLFCDTQDFDTARERITQYAKQVVITRGKRGVALYDGYEWILQTAYPVMAIDTIGAGDIFAGALLYALTHGYDYRTAGDIACLAASHVITKFGPRLDGDGLTSVRDHIKQLAYQVA